MRSLALSVSVCLSVYVCPHLSNFCEFSVLARSSSDDSEIRYVFPVLWITDPLVIPRGGEFTCCASASTGDKSTCRCKHPSLHSVGGAVAQRVERWTCNQQVVGSIPTRCKPA